MKHIGFCGGSSIVELGSASDMAVFFDCLNKHAGNARDKKIASRLYKKYVYQDDLEETLLFINGFSVNLARELKEKYSKYIEGIEFCIKSAQGFYEDWSIYKPVRVVVTDMPDYMIDRERPVEEYDKLGPNDPPFWLR